MKKELLRKCKNDREMERVVRRETEIDKNGEEKKISEMRKLKRNGKEIY